MHGVVRPATADGETGPVPVLRVQLFAGLFMALNVMALSFAFYGPGVFGDEAVPRGTWGSVAELFEYLILFLTTIVVATLGLPLFIDALQDGRGKFAWVNARTMVCLGVFAAFSLSAWHTLRGLDGIYYDTVTMVLVAVTLGKHLEARAKRRAAMELGTALADLPDRVEAIREGRRLELAVDSLQRGDLVCVKPGQAVPVDGVVDEGCGFVDSSGITGEPHSVSLAAGDRVYAGALSIDGLLWVRAERVDDERLLARVDRLLHEALESRFPAVLTADRIARILAPAVMLISFAVLAFFWRRDLAAEGLMRGLSVLLIACPCALAIGPGLIVASAMRRAARHGIVFSDPAAVERTAGLRRMFVDKTGTLTRATSRVDHIQVADPERREELLGLWASIEAHGDHPVAQGLVRYARERGVSPRRVESCRTLAGRGVEAIVDGNTYRVGGARLLQSLDIAPAVADDGEPRAYLLAGRRILASARVFDPSREDAAHALERLAAQKIEVSGLSGDTEQRSQDLGRILGIPIVGNLLPEQKVTHVKRAVEETPGAVAMVGDGVNDAAALGSADVGFAMASATDLSKRAGDVLLLRDSLTLLPEAVEIARDVRRRLVLSLGWAIGYNAVGVLLAASGRLHPAFAATAMAVSSLLVIGFARNAGRLGDETPASTTPHPVEASA